MKPMKLLLMRHGQAEVPAESDFSRRLTVEGRISVKQRAEYLSDNAIWVKKMLVSPYVRTKETAVIMSAVAGQIECLFSDEITPDVAPQEAADALKSEFAEISVGLAIMHQPVISKLILYLTGDSRQMSPANLAIIDAPIIGAGCCELICVI